MADQDQKKTAFITKYGLFEFSRMSFGLCNAPATYARLMNLVLKGLNWNIALAFLDDIMVLGKDVDDHIRNLEKVLARFMEYGIKLKPRKCELFQQKVEFLGHEVSQEGIKVQQKFVEEIQKWPVPKCTKDIQRFMGFVNYHRSFIEKMSDIASPLNELTGKKEFHWGNAQQAAFDQLKSCLTTAPVLSFPNVEDPFILDTDASQFALGAVLSQIQQGKERVIAYASCTIPPENRNYCTTRRELLAVIKFTHQFKHYLLGKPFTVRTDHSSLTWLLNFKNPQGQIARWIEQLSQFDIRIVHRPGNKHTNVDALSRLTTNEPCKEFRVQVQPQDLPCGGCKHCVKAHTDWYRFANEVDDTVAFLSTHAKQVKQITVVPNGPVSRLVVCRGPTDCEIGLDQEDGVVLVGYNSEQLKEFQRQEPKFEWIIAWLEDSSFKVGNELKSSSPEEKCYWLTRQSFELDEEGFLWEKSKGQGQPRRWMVPHKLRQEVLRLNHDVPLSGHQGATRTVSRVKRSYVWYGVTADIKRYVSSCEICGKHKRPSRNQCAPLTNFNTGSPLERVHIDFMGPFPKSES